MTDRRTFLTRSGLALGALLLGDEALDAFARLTHVRKSFPSAGVGERIYAYREEFTWAPGITVTDWRVDLRVGGITVVDSYGGRVLLG